LNIKNIKNIKNINIMAKNLDKYGNPQPYWHESVAGAFRDAYGRYYNNDPNYENLNNEYLLSLVESISDQLNKVRGQWLYIMALKYTNLLIIQKMIDSGFNMQMRDINGKIHSCIKSSYKNEAVLQLLIANNCPLIGKEKNYLKSNLLNNFTLYDYMNLINFDTIVGHIKLPRDIKHLIREYIKMSIINKRILVFKKEPIY
jgi:hypothetical protein